MTKRWLLAPLAAVVLGFAGCGLPPTGMDFAPDRVTGPAPLAVTFTLSGAESAQAVAWDFGDGATSSDVRPTHVYTQAGTYTVTVSVQTSGGPVTVRKAGLIQVTGDGGVDSLFWIERGSGVIRRATLEGESATTILAGLIGPEDLTVQGGRVYWTDPGAGTVESADLDGTNRRIIAANQNYPTGVAVDAIRSRVYWTTLPSALDATPAMAGAIRRAHLDGSGVETLQSFSPQASFAWQIVVDPAQAKLYWVANDWAGIGGSSRAAVCRGEIVRSDLDARNIVTLARDLCGATDVALSAGEGPFVYWTDEDAGTVFRMSAGGGNSMALVTGQAGAESAAVSAKAGKIYWIAGDALVRSNLDGSGVESLLHGLNLPEGVAVGG